MREMYFWKEVALYFVPLMELLATVLARSSRTVESIIAPATCRAPLLAHSPHLRLVDSRIVIVAKNKRTKNSRSPAGRPFFLPPRIISFAAPKSAGRPRRSTRRNATEKYAKGCNTGCPKTDGKCMYTGDLESTVFLREFRENTHVICDTKINNCDKLAKLFSFSIACGSTTKFYTFNEEKFDSKSHERMTRCVHSPLIAEHSV